VAYEPPADIVPKELREAYGQRSFTFRHNLTADTGFHPSVLAEMTRRVPDAWVKVSGGEPAIHNPDRGCADTDLTPHEVLSSLEHNGCAGRIYHFELTPEHRATAAALRAGVEAAGNDLEGGVTRAEVSAFFASPGAITSCHPDRHHNLLFQIHGTKELASGRFTDPGRNQRELERSFLAFGAGPTELPDGMTVQRLGPGDAIYLPPYEFHWARVLEGASVALSFGWSTPASDRGALVHAFNFRLRQRVPLRPAAPGRSAARDRAKAALMARRLRGLQIEA
jgi:hypothetical protein